MTTVTFYVLRVVRIGQ